MLDAPSSFVLSVLTFGCPRAQQAGDVDEEDEGSDVSGSDTPSELLDDDDMYDDDDVRKSSVVDEDLEYLKLDKQFRFQRCFLPSIVCDENAEPAQRRRQRQNN